MVTCAIVAELSRDFAFGSRHPTQKRRISMDSATVTVAFKRRNADLDVPVLSVDFFSSSLKEE